MECWGRGFPLLTSITYSGPRASSGSRKGQRRGKAEISLDQTHKDSGVVSMTLLWLSLVQTIADGWSPYKHYHGFLGVMFSFLGSSAAENPLREIALSVIDHIGGRQY